MLKTAFITNEEGLEVKNGSPSSLQYWIEELNDPTFFPGHGASIHARIAGSDVVIGSFGILHPTILEKFELKYPVSVVEFNVEVFL